MRTKIATHRFFSVKKFEVDFSFIAVVPISLCCAVRFDLINDYCAAYFYCTCRAHCILSVGACLEVDRAEV